MRRVVPQGRYYPLNSDNNRCDKLLNLPGKNKSSVTNLGNKKPE